MHDWLRLRFGVLGRVTDGVASPTSAAEVRTLLAWAREHGVQVLPSGRRHQRRPATSRPWAPRRCSRSPWAA